MTIKNPRAKVMQLRKENFLVDQSMRLSLSL